MTPQQFYEGELERLRADWENGDFRAIADAVALLAVRDPEWPEWLITAVMGALATAFEAGGAPGKGKTGGHLARARRADIDAKRHQVAFFELALRRRGETREDAFEAAHVRLRATFAKGSASAIQASYNRHQRRLRNRG